MNARFFCNVGSCGRAFQNENDLKVHLSRRHGINTTESVEVKDDHSIDPSDDIKKRLFGDKKTRNQIPAKTQAKELSNSLILDACGDEGIEEVTELILRDKGIKSFASSEIADVDHLISLEYLCLSHNYIENIEGLTNLLGLQELNLNNNQISDLSSLENLSQLRRLFLSNNQVKVILPIKGLKQITELTLYNNKLFDLEASLSILRELPKLKTLELERNPCVLQTQNSRYKILNSLRLDSLDGIQVTDVDVQLTFNLFGERETFIPKNLIGRLRMNAEVQSSVERDLLYQEVEELREELEEVKLERDQLLEEKERLSIESPEALKDENLRLKREVAGMYALLDEINELKSKLRAGIGEYASEIFEENCRLRARVMELELKQKDVVKRPQTSAGIRPVTASAREMSSDEIYEYIERNNRMLINLDNKVSAYKKDLQKYGNKVN